MDLNYVVEQRYRQVDMVRFAKIGTQTRIGGLR